MTMRILDQKDRLIDENLKFFESQDVSKFDLMNKLVQLEKVEQIKKAYEESLITNIQDDTQKPAGNFQNLIKKIKEEDVGEFKAVKACEREKK